MTAGSEWRKSGLRVTRRATEARTTTSLLNNAYVHKSQRTKWLLLLRKPISYMGGEQWHQPYTATLLIWADRRQEHGCLQACYSNFWNISRYRKEIPCKKKNFEEGQLKLSSTVCENTATSPPEEGISLQCFLVVAFTCVIYASVRVLWTEIQGRWISVCTSAIRLHTTTVRVFQIQNHWTDSYQAWYVHDV